jgi:hypothetical protein
VEPHNIVTHCLSVLHKIDGQVKEIGSCPPTSTVYVPLSNAIQYLEDHNGGPVTTIVKFYSVLKAYIAGHSTDNDCHDRKH